MTLKDQAHKSRLAAILAADVVGYSRLMAADAAATMAALEETRSLFRVAIVEQGGRVVDMVGDSVLALFPTAGGALTGALRVQKAIEAASRDALQQRRMLVRIGLHLGDVIEKADGTVYGHGINVAARLQAKARPGGVCLSQPLYESVKPLVPAEARFGGRQRLKNIDEPVAVWHIVPEGATGLPRYSPEALDAAPNNLPLQLTSFVGREAELAEVTRLLSESRLLTLLGAGGIGKSRLSLEAAAGLIDDFDDGVWLVELAPLRDARLVPQAVASAIGVKESPGRSLGEALAGHFRERRMLLILDNCEHLIAGCAEFARHMLQASPHLRVLASSREPLRIAGETTYAVPALPENEALRLFEDRAAKARPGFRVSNSEAAAVTSICRRLDGLPLAIELAASRVRTLSVKTIDARLDDRFRLLNRGDQTALPRQQTLRALIDWSYDLLTEDERAVFRRLAVFAGGWTETAAEAVTVGRGVSAPSVLEHLAQLVEKSLAVLEASGERYRLLDTMRQYAQERLDEAGEAQEVRTRHLCYYLEVAEKARPELSGPRQGEWLARLDLERENLLAAHVWCDRVEDGAELGLKLAYLLRPFWVNRGLLDLGRRVTDEALARPRAQARDFARCRGLFDAGQIAFFMGNLAEAQRALQESLAIAREIGDERRIAVALYPLGMAHLGQGDATTARRYLDEALALARRRGEPREIAAATNALAQFYRVSGELDRAEPLYQEALRLARSVDDRDTIVVGLINLAMVAVARGAAEHARGLTAQALAIVLEIGSRRLGQSLLEVCAGLAVLTGDAERTARFYGAAEAQTEQTGLHRDAADAAFLDPLVAKARAALGGPAFSAQESQGRALPYETALDEARDWLRSS